MGSFQWFSELNERAHSTREHEARACAYVRTTPCSLRCTMRLNVLQYRPFPTLRPA